MKISIAKLFFLLAFLSCFLFLIRPIGDPDFWWHIKTGQLILQEQNIPHFDQYSFSMNGAPWIAHEWMSEVFLYLTYHIGGVTFTQIIFALITLFAFGLSIACTFEKSNLYALGISVFLGILLSTPVLWARPQIFSLINFSIFYFLLTKYKRTGAIKYIIPIPILMIFWVNQHGAFIIGLGLIGIFILGQFLENISSYRQNVIGVTNIFSKKLLMMIGLLLVSFVATLVNPNGSKIILYPFQTINDPSLQAFIQEWASPNFHESIWIPLILMFLGVLGFGLYSKKVFSITEILLVVIFGYLALMAVKQIMYFAIISIPILSDLISDILPYKAKTQQNPKFNLIIGILSITILVIIGVYRITHLEQKQTKLIADTMPVNALKFISDNEIDQKIFNSYNWGGFLIWNLYPQNKVYIDGRCDMYGSAFVHRYVDISTTKPGWQNALVTDGIKYVLIEPNTYLAQALKSSPEWQTLYSDNVSDLFERVTP